ncbi:MAG: hypothetical protein AAF657_24680 [Acidobacteriota bacterium]
MAVKRAILTFKSGDTEVRYEAEREAVEAQLEHIVDRVLRDAPAGVEVGITPPPQVAGAPGLGSPPDGAAKTTRSAAADPDPAEPATAEPGTAEPAAVYPTVPSGVSEAERLQQLYRVDDKGRLRLRKRPGRAADTLLLALYGLLAVQNREWVHAPGMTGVARASGASFERADRLLAGYDDLVEGFGKRRGKRYRLTAAGRDHCRRLVEALVGPIDPQVVDPGARAAAAQESSIPKKVTSRWDGELLLASETAERLGVDVTEIGRLRHAWVLLGLPGGTRKRRRYFYPSFQIDAARSRIDPQVRKANQLVSRRHTSWGIAEWWSTVEPELGKRPMDLIGTPEAEAVARAARAAFAVSS